jgi:DNA polymerase-3 subunit delta'
VARYVAGQAQPDLFILERTINEKSGKLFQDIQVDDVRRMIAFFGKTAGERGWRVAIVDAVDELNTSGANALLKVLEEPPRRALLLLVSHSAGRVLPTIRSRCRVLALRPLAEDDVARAAAAALDRDAADGEVRAAAAAAEGIVARALALVGGDLLALRRRLLELLDQLPAVDARKLHALGDALGSTEAKPLAAFADTVNGWLSARLADATGEPARAVRVAQAWDRINRATRDVGDYNLDRRPLLFAVFAALADATRG